MKGTQPRTPDRTLPRNHAGMYVPPTFAWFPAAIALIVGFVVGCSSPSRKAHTFDPRSTPQAAGFESVAPTNQLDPAWLQPSREPHRLGPGDQLDIELLGGTDGITSTFVGPDGKIYFHLLPGLQVWGLSLPETKALLEKELTRYIRSPQIALTLRAVHSRRVWVMGRVNTPGIYTLNAPMTVIEAISKAGGLFTSRFSGSTEELADLQHSFVMRRGQMLPINLDALIRGGDTSQNIYLEPDDFVYLPSALSSEVYVLGAVAQPRMVAFKNELSLLSAIATARGPAPGAWLKHVAIVRGSLSTPAIAIVDYEAIVHGRETDVRLQPRDIVYIPQSPYSKLDSYARLIVSTFVKAVAANEGGRAVDTTIGSPGVSIPIGQ